MARESPFLWTDVDGLSRPPGWELSSRNPVGLSADGSLVIWRSDTGAGSIGYRWTEEGGFVADPDLAGVTGMSADGTTFVRVSQDINSPSFNIAERRSGLESWMPLGVRSTTVGGLYVFQVWDLSDDGSIGTGPAGRWVAGGFGLTGSGQWAYWTEDAGLSFPGLAAGNGLNTSARAVSGDGQAVAGHSVYYSQFSATRWTPSGGERTLGWSDTVAYDISGDGLIVVGMDYGARTQFGSPIEHGGFLWTEAEGMQPIEAVLTAKGASFPGWTDLGVTNISADGNIIAGVGLNPEGQYEAWRATLDGNGAATQFTNTMFLDVLAVDFTNGAPETLAFYVSDDSSFSPADTKLFEVEISAAEIAASEFLVDLVALPGGGKRLRIDPATPEGALLKIALENGDRANIFAVGTATNGATAAFPFRGFYRAANSELAVIRTGPDTSDLVSIGADTLSYRARNIEGVGIKGGSASAVGVERVLVVTTELDDVINVRPGATASLDVWAGAGNDEIDTGAADDDLHGASGDDVYHFYEVAAGEDRIFDDSGQDRLDFERFAHSVQIDLTLVSPQAIGGMLTLKLENADVIEDVTGSEHDDRIWGNDLKNKIEGRGGNDILVGRDGGGDQLFGDVGDDVLWGEGFSLGVQSFTASFGTINDFLANTLSNLDLDPTAGASDIIYGGDGDDFIVGGDGNDELYGDYGGGMIFGDSFFLDPSPGFSFDPSSILSDLTLVAPFLVNAFEFGEEGSPGVIGHHGSGGDQIFAGSYSTIVVGGAGNDVISGASAGTSILLGNDGEDTIVGLEGYDQTTVIFGGAGADTRLAGGNGLNVIFGDSIEFGLGMTFEPTELAVQDIGIINQFLLNITLQGSAGDGDNIFGGGGSNVIIGGPGGDTIEGGNTTDGLDLLFGNAGADTILGKGGTNLIFGGDNVDTLTGGQNFNFIVGGELTFGSPNLREVMSATSLTGILAMLETLLADTEVVGSGWDRITGGDGTNVLLGGPGPDVITGGDNPLSVDALFGFDSTDSIHGKAGFNLIVGGREGDNLTGGNDGNVIIGDVLELDDLSIDFDKLLSLKILEAFKLPKFQVVGDPSDSYTIIGGAGFDFLAGGPGSDTITGGDGLNVAFGDEIDLQVGGVGGVLQAFAEIATTFATIPVGGPLAALGTVSGIITGFADVWRDIFGDPADSRDTYFGGNGVDIVFGGGGDDILQGGTGKDLLVGGWGNDYFQREPDEPFVADGFFADIAFGGPGDDVFQGGNGPDYLASTEGDDVFYGGPGDDTIFGGAGIDEIYGGDGNDSLFGEEGDDLIVPGPGTDLVEDNQGTNRIIVGADYDGSGTIDQGDYSTWVSSFGSTLNLAADGNGNGVIDAADFVFWRDRRVESPAIVSASDFSEVIVAADDLTSRVNLMGAMPRSVAAPSDDKVELRSPIVNSGTVVTDSKYPIGRGESATVRLDHPAWIAGTVRRSFSLIEHQKLHDHALMLMLATARDNARVIGRSHRISAESIDEAFNSLGKVDLELEPTFSARVPKQLANKVARHHFRGVRT